MDEKKWHYYNLQLDTGPIILVIKLFACGAEAGVQPQPHQKKKILKQGSFCQFYMIFIGHTPTESMIHSLYNMKDLIYPRKSTRR